MVGKVVLVLATLVCLSSLGGAMLFAFPVLVPLHWLAARRSGPWGTFGWALLAGASLYEAGWMILYIVSDGEALSLLGGAAIGAAAMTAFFMRRTRRPALAEEA